MTPFFLAVDFFLIRVASDRAATVTVSCTAAVSPFASGHSSSCLGSRDLLSRGPSFGHQLPSAVVVGAFSGITGFFPLIRAPPSSVSLIHDFRVDLEQVYSLCSLMIHNGLFELLPGEVLSPRLTFWILPDK